MNWRSSPRSWRGEERRNVVWGKRCRTGVPDRGHGAVRNASLERAGKWPHRGNNEGSAGTASRAAIQPVPRRVLDLSGGSHGVFQQEGGDGGGGAGVAGAGAGDAGAGGA